MTALDKVLKRLKGVRKAGKEYVALCPAHDDNKPSLSITQKNGRVLIHCHAGCKTEYIVEKLCLKMKDLYDNHRSSANVKPNIVARYQYRDASGRLLYEVVRLKPKSFRFRRPNTNGKWDWSLNGVEVVPYRLPEVSDAVKYGKQVFVVEGEKDADKLTELGLVATTNPGGAGKWKESFSQWFEGANVVILPDNDDPGRKHAEDVASKLHGTAASIKVVILPGLDEKQDVSDWLYAGHTRDELLAIVDQTIEWEPAETEATGATPQGLQENLGPDGFALTEIGNGERLIAKHGKNLRYNIDTKKWLVWSGIRWECDKEREVKRMATDVIRSLYSLLPELKRPEADALYKHAKKSESVYQLNAMIEAAANCKGIPVTSSELDADPLLLCCKNGTLDLRTGELREHRREDLITLLCPVEYNPDATAPRWEQFLDEVFQGDAELIAFIKRCAGYWLTGITKEQCAFFLVGKGANGKTTFIETLRYVMGDYAGDTPFSTFLKRRDQCTADLASLVGKRLVTASECEEGQEFSESLLKKVTGSDPLTVRHLYCEPFTYRPAFKVVFCTNEVPCVRSQDYAMKRRFTIIPFRQRFYDEHEGRKPVRDKNLIDKLSNEGPGILRWAVEGCLEWQRTGLNVPKCVRDEVEQYFESQDPLAEWLESRCVIGPGYETEVSILWDDYMSWCEANRRKPAYKQVQRFSNALAQRDEIERRRGTHGVRLIAGVGLKNGISEESAQVTSVTRIMCF